MEGLHPVRRGRKSRYQPTSFGIVPGPGTLFVQAGKVVPIDPTPDTEPIRHVAEVMDIKFEDWKVLDDVGLFDHTFFL